MTIRTGWVGILLITGLFIRPCQGQVTAAIWTDHSVYGAHESVEVHLLLSNTGPSVEILPSRFLTFRVDDTDLNYAAIIPEQDPLYFSPGGWRQWTWTMDPDVLGLPRSDGLHTITANIAHFSVSTQFTAPKSMGGRARIGLIASTPTDSISAIAARLNATILDERTFSNGEKSIYIAVEDLDIYDAKIELEAHPNVRYFDLDQYITGVMSTDTEADTPSFMFEVSPPYPQPASDHFSFSVSMDRAVTLKIDIYDILGRRVRSIFEGTIPPGEQQPFYLDTSELTTSLYFVTLSSSNRVRTMPVVVQK